MLSPAVRAAAAAFANTQLGKPAMPAIALGYETGYAAGFIARPQPAHFPLAGQREFLQVFGPYLAYDIDVYHPFSGRYGKLKGLPACSEGQGEPLADVEFYCDQLAYEAGGGDQTAPVGKILPVLYGFEDLATEMLLPDGRRVVPAVEVAKLNGQHENIDGAEFIRDIFGNTVLSLTANGKHLWSEWSHNFEKADIGYPLAKVEWLRQHHFAIGLRPHQYHRRVVGFDYASGEKPERCAGCDRKGVCRA